MARRIPQDGAGTEAPLCLDTELLENYFRTAQTLLAQHETEMDKRVESHFTFLHTQLDVARIEAERENQHWAEGFNVFGYIQPDENRLSQILAHLLDPSESHGQGDTFLRKFAEKLKVTSTGAFRSVSVCREETTTYIHNSLRRIDIVLDFVLDSGRFGIGIENKPWAEEQPDQDRDYLEQLRRQFGKNFLLVYLSGKGCPPESVPVPELVRLEEQNQFRLLAYPTGFLEWLNTCVDYCRAEKVRSFLRDFGLYVKEHFPLATADWRRTN